MPLNNAIDACTRPAAPRQIPVVEMWLKKDPRGVEYGVRDNGEGMEPALQKKLFQAFTTTKGSRGTGIGLMLVRKIVEAHNGSINVESEPGKGSRFTIRLPVRQP